MYTPDNYPERTSQPEFFPKSPRQHRLSISLVYTNCNRDFFFLNLKCRQLSWESQSFDLHLIRAELNKQTNKPTTQLFQLQTLELPSHQVALQSDKGESKWQSHLMCRRQRVNQNQSPQVTKPTVQKGAPRQNGVPCQIKTCLRRALWFTRAKSGDRHTVKIRNFLSNKWATHQQMAQMSLQLDEHIKCAWCHFRFSLQVAQKHKAKSRPQEFIQNLSQNTKQPQKDLQK